MSSENPVVQTPERLLTMVLEMLMEGGEAILVNRTGLGAPTAVDRRVLGEALAPGTAPTSSLIAALAAPQAAADEVIVIPVPRRATDPRTRS